MSAQTALITFFKANLTGIEVWANFIPEESVRPAIAISNTSFGNDRTLDGKKTKNQSIWRLTLSDGTVNLQNSIDQILLTDNEVNDDFQRVFVELNQIEAYVSSEPYQRAFFDITYTPK